MITSFLSCGTSSGLKPPLSCRSGQVPLSSPPPPTPKTAKAARMAGKSQSSSRFGWVVMVSGSIIAEAGGNCNRKAGIRQGTRAPSPCPPDSIRGLIECIYTDLCPVFLCVNNKAVVMGPLDVFSHFRREARPVDFVEPVASSVENQNVPYVSLFIM